MAWNPEPKVADCREIARKWGDKEQVIIIAVDGHGKVEIATYGKTKILCACAKAFGDAAFNAIAKLVRRG